MDKKIYLLVDCNSFYCSCEQIFTPGLKNNPIVVLSNNDGCIVSMTKDLKVLGIKTGAPLFQVESKLKKANTKIFSSNYTLYADI